MDKKRIVLYRDHVVIRPPECTSSASVLDQLHLMPRAVSTLSAISSQESFELVLLVPSGKEADSALCRQIHEKVLELLEQEGVVFKDIITAAEAGSLSDTQSSLVIGATLGDISLAEGLSCRSVLLGEAEGALPEHCIASASSWQEIGSMLLGGDIMLPPRSAEIVRKTSETDITVGVNLDGTGDADISTGLAFLDHMLHQLAKHGRMDLMIKARGDLEIDEHHTVEDIAIVLGQAVLKALGDKRGISRYGFLLPMDDSLAQAAVDFSGRPWLLWDVHFRREYVGDLPTDMIFHFFKSFSDESRCNLSLKAEGHNDHHIAEALFKAFARAIRMAVTRDPLNMVLPSTKGAL